MSVVSPPTRQPASSNALRSGTYAGAPSSTPRLVHVADTVETTGGNSSQPPERTVEADRAEVGGRGHRGAALVAAVEAPVVPVLRQSPERRQVHRIAARIAGRRQP